MPGVPEQRHPEVGSFTFAVYGSGRNGRRTASRFTVRCDALALHQNEILLLSVVGPETGVKALTAGLRSSGSDQQRIDYSAQVGEVHNTRLTKCPESYRVYRTKLEYGLWHVLLLSRRESFLPVLTEETVWQQLRGSRFTTPLLRSWLPWLVQGMKRREHIVELTQSGCQAGLLLVDDAALDDLVSEGVRTGHLVIDGPAQRRNGRKAAVTMNGVDGLDAYLRAYGPLLGK